MKVFAFETEEAAKEAAAKATDLKFKAKAVGKTLEAEDDFRLAFLHKPKTRKG